MPDKEGCHQQREQDQAATCITDAEGACREICQRGSHGGRCDDGGPVEEGMEFAGAHLGENSDQKQDGKDAGADKVAEIHRHRNGIAACLAKCCRKDFDDPEDQCDFWHLAENGLLVCVHKVGASATSNRLRRGAWLGRCELRPPPQGTPPPAGGRGRALARVLNPSAGAAV